MQQKICILVLCLLGSCHPALLEGEEKIIFDKEEMVLENNQEIEGYWASSEDPAKDIYGGKYPFPKKHAQPFAGQENFVLALKKVQVSNQVESEGQKGYSACRFADAKTNGSREFILRLSGREIHWPEGFLHYITQHNVVPSRAFYQLVMGFAKNL